MATTPYRCIDSDGIVWELSGRWGEGFRRVTPEPQQVRGAEMAPDAELAGLVAALKATTR